MMASICFSETEVIWSLSFQLFVIPDLIRDPWPPVSSFPNAGMRPER